MIASSPVPCLLSRLLTLCSSIFVRCAVLLPFHTNDFVRNLFNNQRVLLYSNELVTSGKQGVGASMTFRLHFRTINSVVHTSKYHTSKVCISDDTGIASCLNPGDASQHPVLASKTNDSEAVLPRHFPPRMLIFLRLNFAHPTTRCRVFRTTGWW